MPEGWISVYRKIEDCWLWLDDEPFDKRSAWIDLLLMANHKDKKIMFNGTACVIKAGQRITSIKGLAERWKWSRHKVSNFLNVLEADGMITQNRDNKRTLINIVNYDVYQTERRNEGHQKDIKRTSKGHQKDTNNNENNENNDNKKNIKSNPEELDSLRQRFEQLYQTYHELNRTSNGKSKARDKFIRWCTTGCKVGNKTVKLTPERIEAAFERYVQDHIETEERNGWAPNYKNIDTVMNNITDWEES